MGTSQPTGEEDRQLHLFPEFSCYISFNVKMTDAMKGTYTRTSAEKYEEILAELGVNFLLRKADGVWTIKTSTTLKSMELKFKIGEEFDETTPDGRDVKAIVTFENGNQFVSVQTAKKDGQKSTKVIREFNGDEVVQTMTVVGKDDLVCVQKFKRN